MNGSLGRSFQSEVLVDGVALIHNLAAVPLRVRFHVGVEPLGRTGKVPVGLAPNLVSVKQRLRAGVDPPQPVHSVLRGTASTDRCHARTG